MRKPVYFSWPLFIGLVFLGGCKGGAGSPASKGDTDGGSGETVELTAVDLSLDGTTTGQVADGETSVVIDNVSATEYVRQVVIDLGAHFLTENICSGNTIFGRVGGALCPEEITAASAFRSTGSPTMKDELAAGGCSNGGNPVAAYTKRVSCEKADAANVWTPEVMTGERIATTTADTTNPATTRNLATFSYASGAWSQTDIAAGLTCGASGNIETRITDCNRQWRASVGSKDGGGTWSLVSRQDLAGTKYEVWRDDKTGLIWSDNLGSGDHCEATGDDAGVANCNGTFTRSFCAETGFSGNVTGITIESATGTYPTITAYDAKKGGMGMNSANPVLWRLPTLKDYTTAYGNGMAFVLPRLGHFWTASVSPTNPVFAMYFSVYSSAYVNSYDDSRPSTFDVRCVGR